MEFIKWLKFMFHHQTLQCAFSSAVLMQCPFMQFLTPTFTSSLNSDESIDCNGFSVSRDLSPAGKIDTL